MVELLQLRYFQTVARLEHMTKAAQYLQIAQSSLSKTIARLEEDLGVPLFERNGRNLRLNVYGRTFLEHVDCSLRELDEGRTKLKDMAGVREESVTLAVSLPRILPEMLGSYLVRYPNSRLRQSLKSTAAMIDGLITGEIDLCIFSGPIESTDVISEPLLLEEIYIIVPRNHGLASRASIRLEELRDEPFISISEGYGFRDLTDEFCRQAGFSPNIAYEGDQLDVIAGLVQHGLGIAFIPALTWQKGKINQTHRLRIEDPVCRRTIAIGWAKERSLPHAVARLKGFIADYFEALKPEMEIEENHG